MSLAPAVSPPAPTVAAADLTEIAARWKFRPNGGASAASSLAPHRNNNPAATCIAPPPDIRSEFLKLRADLLRREPLIAQVSSLDNELGLTIEKLRSAEQEVKDVRRQLQELQLAYEDAQDAKERQAETIARLQHELHEAKRHAEEEKALRLKLQASPPSSHPQSGVSSGVHHAAQSSPNLAAVRNVIMAPSVKNIYRAVSPSSSQKTLNTSRSPARTR